MSGRAGCDTIKTWVARLLAGLSYMRIYVYGTLAFGNGDYIVSLIVRPMEHQGVVDTILILAC